MPFDSAKSLTKNAAFLVSARLLPRLLQMVYVIVLARFLGPELYGLFASGQSWYLALLPITSFGLHLLLSKAIATNPHEASDILAPTLAFRTGMATSIAVLSVGAAQLLEPDHGARMLLLIFSCALLGRAIVNWTEHVFVVFESTQYALRCELCFRPLESSVGVLILVAGGKVFAVAILHALIWCLHALTALMIIRRRLAAVGFWCNWQKVRELLGFGWPLSLNVFCTGFLLQGPMVAYRYLAPSDPDIGQIAVPLQAIAILCILPAAVSASSLPVLARSVHRADGQDLLFGRAMIRLVYGFGTLARRYFPGSSLCYRQYPYWPNTLACNSVWLWECAGVDLPGERSYIRCISVFSGGSTGTGGGHTPVDAVVRKFRCYRCHRCCFAVLDAHVNGALCVNRERQCHRILHTFHSLGLRGIGRLRHGSPL